eukprot:101452-Heterocapsa_arctica.AAC.1
MMREKIETSSRPKMQGTSSAPQPPDIRRGKLRLLRDRLDGSLAEVALPVPERLAHLLELRLVDLGAL